MALKCSAEDRAKQLESEIMQLVAEGKIRLRNMTYGMDLPDGSCVACALGSAARAISGLPLEGFSNRWCYPDPVKMRQFLSAKGVATYEETMMMEQGFESAPQAIGWGPAASNPFFQLGRRLRAVARGDNT